MNNQTPIKKHVRCCMVFFAIILLLVILLGLFVLCTTPKRLTTNCSNIRIHTELDFESIPNQIYFSEEGRYLYIILADENVWRYDILLGEKEKVDRATIPDPSPLFTLPDETLVGDKLKWSEMKNLKRYKYVFSPTGKIVMTINTFTPQGEDCSPHVPTVIILIQNVSQMSNKNIKFTPWIAGLNSIDYLVCDAVISNDNRIVATIQAKGTKKEKTVVIWFIEDKRQ